MNIIRIKVQTNSSKRKVVRVDHPEYLYKVYVNSSPEKGKANKEVIELLAGYFKVNKTDIEISSGETSSRKTVRID